MFHRGNSIDLEFHDDSEWLFVMYCFISPTVCVISSIPWSNLKCPTCLPDCLNSHHCTLFYRIYMDYINVLLIGKEKFNCVTWVSHNSQPIPWHMAQSSSSVRFHVTELWDMWYHGVPSDTCMFSKIQVNYKTDEDKSSLHHKIFCIN